MKHTKIELSNGAGEAGGRGGLRHIDGVGDFFKAVIY